MYYNNKHLNLFLTSNFNRKSKAFTAQNKEFNSIAIL